MKSMNVLAVLV